jgi:hypothetical protein
MGGKSFINLLDILYLEDFHRVKHDTKKDIIADTNGFHNNHLSLF